MKNLDLEARGHPFVKINSDDEFDGSYGILESNLSEVRVVKFGPEFASLFRGEYEKGTHIRGFDYDEVKIINQFDYLKLKAKKKFGDQDWDVVDLDWMFSLENECMCHGCDENADQRILHKNDLLIIVTYDVCSGHAYFDGKDESEIPFIMKRDYQPRVKELKKKLQEH